MKNSKKKSPAPRKSRFKFKIGELVRLDDSTSCPNRVSTIYDKDLSPPGNIEYTVSIDNFTQDWIPEEKLKLADDFRKNDHVLIINGARTGKIAIVFEISEMGMRLTNNNGFNDWFKKSELKLVDSSTPINFYDDDKKPDIQETMVTNTNLVDSKVGLLPQYRIGDLVRIKTNCNLVANDQYYPTECAIFENSKNKVFKVKSVRDNSIDLFLEYDKITNRPTIIEFDLDEIEPAMEIQVGDRVLVTKGAYKNTVAPILELGPYIGMLKTNDGIRGFNLTDLQLVDSQTPLCEKTDLVDSQVESRPQYKTGDLVRIKSSCLINPHSSPHAVSEDYALLENSKNKVFKIYDFFYDKVVIFLNAERKYHFSLNEIEPATEIRAGDHVRITEGHYQNTITQVLNTKNNPADLNLKGITVKIFGQSYHYFSPSMLQLVDSKTPLVDCIKEKEIIPSTPFWDQLSSALDKPSIDEITHLRSDHDKLHLEINRLTTELALATSDNRTINLESSNKDVLILDFQGQLTLADAQIQRLSHSLTKAATNQRLSLISHRGLSSISKIGKFSTKLVYALSCYLFGMGASLVNNIKKTTKFLSQKTTVIRQEINKKDNREVIIGSIVYILVLSVLSTTMRLDTLWFREERNAALIPAPWHIPSPNDPQERAKIENRLLQEQLKEIKQKFRREEMK